MRIEDIYEQATGVDIKEQRYLAESGDERAKGYEGEFLVLKNLYNWVNLPCKFLLNVEVPTSGGKTTEIDLLMIHSTGIYVFEMKHYKGIIYGDKNGERWTQYFKTQPNVSFKSPLKQNEYHILALQQHVPNMPIYSFIVFTNEEDCQLKVDVHDDIIDVCMINELNRYLSYKFNNKNILSASDIENIFNQLIEYAPGLQEDVVIDGKAVPIYQYINDLAVSHNNHLKLLDKQYSKKEKDLDTQYKEKTSKYKGKITKIALLFIFIAMVGLGYSCNSFKNHFENVIAIEQQSLAEYRLELDTEKQKLEEKEKVYNDFLQKFDRVEPIVQKEYILDQSLVKLENVLLENSKDYKDIVNFSCEIFSMGDKKLVIQESSAITVILNNGEVKEWGIWNEEYPFYKNVVVPTTKTVFGGNELALHELNGIQIENIQYIKLTNIGISLDEGKTLIVDNFEVEVYSSQS